MNQKKLVVVVVVAVLCLLVGLAGLYWFCRRSTASTLQHQQQDLHGKVESSVDADSPPESQVIEASIIPAPRGIPFLRGVTIGAEGVLGVLPSEGGARWDRNTIVVDPAGSMFLEGKYTGSGASGAIYKHFGLTGQQVPLSQQTEDSLVVQNPVLYRSGCQSDFSVSLVHLRSPDMRDVQEVSWIQQKVLSLQTKLCVVLGDLWRVIKEMENSDDEVVRIPLVSSKIYSGGLKSDDYLRAFVGGFLNSVYALKLSDNDLADYLGVGEVRICCYGSDMQRAIEEEFMQTQNQQGDSAGHAKA